MSRSSLLFKISSSSFMDRGVDLSFASAFPAEAECCYSPLTYLKPTGRRVVVHVERPSKDGKAATDGPEGGREGPEAERGGVVEVTVVEVTAVFG